MPHTSTVRSTRFNQRLLVALCLLLSVCSLGCTRMGMATISDKKLTEKYGSPNSEYLEIDGTKIHYRIDGDPQKPTLVLLHGVLASTHTWDGWVARMDDKFRILRIDLPGFGLSEPLANKNYTPEYAVEAFEKIREIIGQKHTDLNTEKFYLAGNSLGGFISWFYATKYPQHIEKMILIDPIAYQQPLPRIIKFASGGFGGTMAQIAALRSIVSRNVRKVYGNPENVTDETVTRYHELLLKKGHKAAMVAYFKVLRKYNDEDSMAKFVPQVKVPTLLMFGAKDRWVPPELVEKYKRDIDGLQVKIYAEGGHISMEEWPEETSRDALAFYDVSASSDVASASGGESEEVAAADTEEAPAEEAVAAPVPAQKKKGVKTASGAPAWE